MNKAELVAVVAEETELSLKDAKCVVQAVIDSIEEALNRGEKVSLVGFGTFEVRYRAARRGRNPKTGESIEIPACHVPVFRPGKDLKEAIR